MSMSCGWGRAGAVLACCEWLGAVGRWWREALGCLQSRRGAEGTLVQGCPLSKACLSSQIFMTAPGVTSDVPPNL